MRGSRWRGMLFGLMGGAALGLAAGAARAQTPGEFALNQLDPAPAGDAFFGVASPYVGGHLVPRAVVLFDHAFEPLTLAEGGGTTAVVASQSFLHVNASLSLWDRLQVSALLPVAIAQSGESAEVSGQVSAAEAKAPAVGDLRLGLRVRMLGEAGDVFQLGAGLHVHLPTGPSDVFVGEGSAREAPHLLVGGRVWQLVWSATLGAVIRTSDNPSTLAYGAGVGVLLWDERLQIGPEVYAQTPLQAGSLPVTERARLERSMATSAEALLGARARIFKGIMVGAAGGLGLGEGLGTPSARLLGAVAWLPEAAEEVEEDRALVDTDADGIVDSADACPYAWGPKRAGAKRSGCPVVDRDEDGVADEDDACPDVAGDAGARGCPADGDGDGVPDADDACPNEKGEVTADAAKNGCPAVQAPPPPVDTDGDGILDDKDACPREKGPESEDAGARGCPKLVRVQGEDVVTLEPVAFRISRADPAPIDPKSEPVLAELVAVVAAHPEWTKVEVQAHTDSTGNAKYNEGLSQARAESVMKWLVGHGVAAERLVAKGYGGSKPVADNGTAAGREKNRRVQLLVLEKK